MAHMARSLPQPLNSSCQMGPRVSIRRGATRRRAVRHPREGDDTRFAGDFIGLQNWSATYWGCRCGSKNAVEPQIAIGVPMGNTGEDALRLRICTPCQAQRRWVKGGRHLRVHRSTTESKSISTRPPQRPPILFWRRRLQNRAQSRPQK
jgi:hypothetical protein